MIYGSHSEDSRKNPLSHKEKFKYLQKMFPSLKKSLQSRAKEKNVMEIASSLNGKFDKLIMVAGSDRVSDFRSLLNSYNGVKSKHGIYEFKEIEVVSAGERDPDAEGVEGMSASKLRSYAQGFGRREMKMPRQDIKNMMNGVRKGLKLDSIREAMKRRRGLQTPLEVENNDYKEAKELSWQGYDTINLSTCDEAFELYDEIVNSIGQSSFTRPELSYLKESLILVDKCLGIACTKEELIEHKDVHNYIECSNKAIKLLEGVGDRLGIPFDYSFLNDLQVEICDNKILPPKTFTQLSGEIHGVR